MSMDFGEIYHFLFETYAGIGVLVAISLVLCVIIAAVLELRTRKTYVDRGPCGAPLRMTNGHFETVSP